MSHSSRYSNFCKRRYFLHLALVGLKFIVSISFGHFNISELFISSVGQRDLNLSFTCGINEFEGYEINLYRGLI